MLIPGTDGQGPEGKGIWAYNYTINPEDGDIGVFCHEFGHDLGLPDEYDYSSATGDASSGFWTIMAGGSWLGRQWGLGTKPAAMNVWDKSALGFIQPKVVKRGRAATVKLQAAAEGRPDATGVKIALPKATHTTRLSTPDGKLEWYSTTGNDVDAQLRTANQYRGPRGRRPHLPHLVRHRGRLRLRLRRGVGRRRRHLGHGQGVHRLRHRPTGPTPSPSTSPPTRARASSSGSST